MFSLANAWHQGMVMDGQFQRRREPGRMDRGAGDLRPKIDICGHTSLVWGSMRRPCRTLRLDQWRETPAMFLNLPIDAATRAMTESIPFKHVVVPRTTKFRLPCPAIGWWRLT